ncbi:MAG TPA: aldolase/citrate lyase family protein [Candidatus Binataceae bacterium]|jgi:citrate lyase subunit beta/citryl-CoA lyase|nr:aldolase/citrate lyase family protein [Candidatus Binataceae bacterium]
MARHDAKPLRTVLFCANTEEAEINAAYTSGADSIVIDLEEPQTPFPPIAQERTRKVVRSFMESIAAKDRPLIFVRVQPPSTGQTLKDLRAAMGERLAGILVPKVQGPADIHAADALLGCMEVDLGLPMGRTMIYPILETAPALRLAYEIAIASSRVSYMGGAISRFGDIHQAVGYRWTADGRETLFLRSKVLLDAKAAGIRYPISGMWGGDLDDEKGLRAWCKELRDLGYYGMMIGNPRLVPTVHEYFTPTASEIAYWKDLDRLAAEAEAAGTGPIIYGDPNRGEGHRVHIAHVGSARKNLVWARELGVA